MGEDAAGEKQPETVEELKELGNTAVKNRRFEEAILHYTHAIKRDPKNHVLYSNRSYAFLKLQQYSLAMEDASETIKRAPNWPKGFFRKAEIEYATSQYKLAAESYEIALRLKPDDEHVQDCVAKARKAQLIDEKADEQIPWLGAGVGIVVGVLIVIADYVVTVHPTHPILMAVVTVIIAIVGYFVGKGVRYYIKSQRESLLFSLDQSDNEDAAEDGKTDSNGSNNRNGPRYSKSQARQRYKKGKQ